MRGVVGLLLAGWVGGAVSGVGQEPGPARADPVAVTRPVMSGQLTLRAGAGTVRYEESASLEDVHSSFEAPQVSVLADYRYTDRSGFKLRGRADLWGSDGDEESWHSRGKLVQRNQLETAGIEVEGAFGYDLLFRSPAELNLWLGLGYRAQGFDRSRFRSIVYEEAPASADRLTVGNIEEDYQLGLFRIGLDGSAALGPKLTVSAEAGYAGVFFNEADNQALGSIDGEGGHTFDVGLDLSYAVTQRDAVGAGIRYSYQELEGDYTRFLFATPEGLVPQTAEWPDNELERITGDLFWRRRL